MNSDRPRPGPVDCRPRRVAGPDDRSLVPSRRSHVPLDTEASELIGSGSDGTRLPFPGHRPGVRRDRKTNLRKTPPAADTARTSESFRGRTHAGVDKRLHDLPAMVAEGSCPIRRTGTSDRGVPLGTRGCITAGASPSSPAPIPTAHRTSADAITLRPTRSALRHGSDLDVTARIAACDCCFVRTDRTRPVNRKRVRHMGGP